jgi:rod shape determining protein RodA
MAQPKQQAISFGEIDRATLGMYIALVLVGWLMIFAVNFKPGSPLGFLDLSQGAGKQLFFMVLCFAMIFVILLTEWSFWRTFGFGIYLFSLVLLPGTLIFGREVNGALAWYQIGGFTFQPSEIAKFGACLAMAAYLSSTGVNLKEWRSRIIAFAIFLLPIGIILLQKDTGSALVFFSFVLVMYREGLSGFWYAVGFGTAAIVILGWRFQPLDVSVFLFAFYNASLIRRFKQRTRAYWIAWVATLALSYWWTPFCNLAKDVPGFHLLAQYENGKLAPHLILCIAAFLPNYLRKNSLVQRRLQLGLFLFSMAVGLVFAANAFYNFLAPHQQQRIKIWLRPAEAAADARGSAYNLLHSKMAIGSGGLAGKGFLQGNMTKLKYVPEQSTDFIFCTVGEEHGFIGTASLIILFILFILRITTLAERQRSNFSRIYMYSVAGILFSHFVVNIGMTMGLFPIIGIPLPFVSYGGSSLIGFTLMIAVLLKLDSNRGMA